MITSTTWKKGEKRPAGPGRNKTTGIFKTRVELEEAVLALSKNKSLLRIGIARKCGISINTVTSIRKEGKKVS